MYATVANELDNLEPVEFITDNDFDITHPDDLAILWRHFRTTDVLSISKYGYPIDNKGNEIKEKIILDDHLIHMYYTVKEWFTQYINYDQSCDTVVVLKIMCPSGGIYISKVNDSSNQSVQSKKHKFVTADLPPEDLAITVVTIETSF
ncbi:Hypothetical protein PACV_59 [Pacmanvirus A23]|uniref:Hypothetical protein n=1 Tax=Pacmanvirus A23 TaxID=1932881 RepID=UPI000A0938C5|nr:Hypothetical protein B9W72_gp059 [Pacmanvirus A23]SIP85776.1 Hypothetical protein PACV_59 [Pacmanvirus A23]